MGQAGNSKRRASLDDQKERAAGRNNGREQVEAVVMPRDMKGRTGGAFGADVKANRAGAESPSAAREKGKPEAGRSTRAARKRKA